MNRIKLLKPEMVDEHSGNIMNMVEALGIDKEPLTSQKITEMIGISGRDFRKLAEDTYFLFMQDKLDGVIIGNKHGYKFTRDSDEISNNLIAKKNNALAQIYNVYHLSKKVSHSNNLSFDDFIKS